MSLRIALLGLLEEAGTASGYDLTKIFELSTSNVWHAKHSQIYPELRKMEADGAVAVAEEGPRGKRSYEITGPGRVELRRWLVEHDPDRSLRSEASLRLFLLPLLEPKEAVPLLRAEAAIYTARARRLDGLCSDMAPTDAGKYQARLGFHSARALGEWAEETADEIERRANTA